MGFTVSSLKIRVPARKDVRSSREARWFLKNWFFKNWFLKNLACHGGNHNQFKPCHISWGPETGGCRTLEALLLAAGAGSG